MKKLILDLCGGTGGWSRPYQEDDRYEVRIIDTQEWLGGSGSTGDVRLFKFLNKPVHGILAAPPCTHFSVSGARWWEEKGEQALLEALSVSDACARIVLFHRPKFWAMENPVGRLRHYIGDPHLIFNPCDYGDPYTKKTLVWGNFNIPKLNPVEPTEGSKMHLLPPTEDRARLRSATPPGFADAFFKANP
jgi:site-specific DNA-cytosine methylase